MHLKYISAYFRGCVFVARNGCIFMYLFCFNLFVCLYVFTLFL